MGKIIINQENFRSYLPLDIAAFHGAAAGASGDRGGANIVTRNGDVYYFNYVKQKMPEQIFDEILPICAQLVVESDGSVSSPSGWKYIYLGMGNSLYIRDEYYVPLKDAWNNYLKTGDGKYKNLYQAWIDLLVNIINPKI